MEENIETDKICLVLVATNVCHIHITAILTGFLLFSMLLGLLLDHKGNSVFGIIPFGPNRHSSRPIRVLFARAVFAIRLTVPLIDSLMGEFIKLNYKSLTVKS